MSLETEKLENRRRSSSSSDSGNCEASTAVWSCGSVASASSFADDLDNRFSTSSSKRGLGETEVKEEAESKRAKTRVYPAVQTIFKCLSGRGKCQLSEDLICHVLSFAFRTCKEKKCKAVSLGKFSFYDSCLECDNTCATCLKYDCNLDICGHAGCTSGWRCLDCLVSCSSCFSRWCSPHISGHQCELCGLSGVCVECLARCSSCQRGFSCFSCAEGNLRCPVCHAIRCSRCGPCGCQAL